jgi:anion-transporting  ArsA/GET3 family ATPase
MNVRGALDRAVRLHAKPDQARRILAHPIYQSLIASLAGMQELMAIERLDQAIADGFESIVVDTAPTRHALEFLDKPEYFVQLVSSPVVKVVGRAYRLLERTPLAFFGRATLEVYARAEELLGATLVRQILDFYAVFHTIAEGYAERARRTAARLRDPGTTGFSVVTTPFKAARDTAFFARELDARKFPLRSVAINRVWPAVAVVLPPGAPAALADTLRWYQDVSRAQHLASAEVRAAYATRIPTVLELPELPRDVDGLDALYQLVEHLDRH